MNTPPPVDPRLTDPRLRPPQPGGLPPMPGMVPPQPQGEYVSPPQVSITPTQPEVAPVASPIAPPAETLSTVPTVPVIEQQPTTLPGHEMHHAVPRPVTAPEVTQAAQQTAIQVPVSRTEHELVHQTQLAAPVLPEVVVPDIPPMEPEALADLLEQTADGGNIITLEERFAAGSTVENP